MHLMISWKPPRAAAGSARRAPGLLLETGIFFPAHMFGHRDSLDTWPAVRCLPRKYDHERTSHHSPPFFGCIRHGQSDWWRVALILRPCLAAIQGDLAGGLTS